MSQFAHSRFASPLSLVIGGMAASVCLAAESALGLWDARSASPVVLLASVLVMAASFWPVFALSLRHPNQRRPIRAWGPVLHAVASLSIMLVGFATPEPVLALPSSLPAVAIALLMGWLAVELAQILAAEARMPRPVAIPGVASAA